ncbi:MAG TPA: O-antigen ligase family protein [Candidatus Acidoferrales bacterium]|nr:O-antigen ligase family protein [Candidatus Acidoferrales bacterium]
MSLPTHDDPTTAARRRFRTPDAGPSRIARVVQVLLLLVAGVVIGMQYVQPDKRVLAVLAALAVAGIAWRLDIITALGLLVFLLPFPRGTVFGTTTVALILLLFIIWLVRVSMRHLPRPHGSPIDMPLVALLILYVLSFYNVRSPMAWTYAPGYFEQFVCCVLMFYLFYNSVRTARDLERLHVAMLVSAFAVFLTAIYELGHPGQALFAGWIDFTATSNVAEGINTHNARVGGVLRDYELLSEYCDLTLLLTIFMLARARTLARKVVLGLFTMLTVFILFATVTRGAIVSLAVATVYLMWQLRQRIKFVPLAIAAGTVAAVFIAMNGLVSTFTRSGDLFGRLAGTKVVNGWVPEDRADVWQNALGRAMVHPFIGQGPYYGEMPGFTPVWPHNVYLYYANILGFTGLAIYLWLLWRFFRLTRPLSDDLADPDYARAFGVIARTQFVLFAVNEFKIDYLRNPIYQMVVWVMFAVWAVTWKLSQARTEEVRLPAHPLLEAAPAPRARTA